MSTTDPPSGQAAASHSQSAASDAPPVEGLSAVVLDVLDRDTARTLAGALENLIDPPPDALSIFEAPDGPLPWRITAYYAEPPDAAALQQSLTDLTGRAVAQPRIEIVPDLNWVALSQAALPPVRAGRFTVHGAHDRHRVPQGPGALLIEAGEAFGTAHHATTYGCLLELDRLTRRHSYARVLDLGCGSGVLAIAVARANPHAAILASDIDAGSVDVARANAAANRCAGRIRVIHAAGLGHPLLRRSAPYDLLIANILAGPLISLAEDIARAVAARGHVVLSGLLNDQAAEVTASYRAAGLELIRKTRIAGWTTLVLSRRAR